MLCPRDGSELVAHTDQTRSAFIDHGISHCPSCSGMLLNAEAAANSLTESKLKKMHEAFSSDCEEVDLDCPCCNSKMRVRNIVFKRINGTDMEPIEIDGCPECNTFWFDAGELQRIVNPDSKPYDDTAVESTALALALEILLQLPFVIL
ncbi:MAG: zf-TFIIB domain-containing protein [Candidatus Thermoplasmatota archaeon]|nr:zf-TFIIB domain-containing protein [Candidatus Thermoplasmatota archaeon]MEC9136925.1 zf-TFIIB domain-containing protein [Candidatus Thermoplasmatota archaeon]MEC9147185.1 zf-TFIIB domain-containing protein [Candidatus Thermoplasmatota archaeon]